MIYNPQQAFFFFVEGSDEEEEYEAIDLGLPSGTLWANKNVGATSETNKDLYFQWGSVEGYSFSDAKIAIKDLPGMSGVTTWNTTYTQDSTSNKLITLWDNTYLGVNELNQDEGNNVLKRQVDAAAYNMGGEWRMPYPSELLELIQYTTATTYKDCMKLTSTVKGYTDKYVLFPIDNVKDDSSSSISYFRGEIWSNVRDNGDNEYSMAGHMGFDPVLQTVNTDIDYKFSVFVNGTPTGTNTTYVGINRWYSCHVRGCMTKPVSE